MKILTAHGMNERDVDLRFIGPDLARVAFEKNELDAWAVWAPWVEQQEATGKGKALPRGEAVIKSVMTVSIPFLDKRETQARAIYRTIQRAKKWMVEHPDEAKEIAAAELGLDRKVIDLAWPKFNWSAQLDEATISDFQAKASFLGEQGKTRQGKELEVRKELVDLRFAGASP
jgi:sulfonate transport system substrate-binding protein